MNDSESNHRDLGREIEPSCPTPRRDYPTITLGHGGGGKLSSELVEQLFLPAFRNKTLAQLADAAVLDLDSTDQKLALTTDSYVVQPLFFPGGCIGDLAVNGTVNDLAMSGATPLCLSAAFILEEGFPIDQLERIVNRMAAAADRAGIEVVTGDTKVVEKGHGDGCYINTTGFGTVDKNVCVSPNRATPGDAVILSGTIGDHGMAVMSVREGLQFESAIQSDTAPLSGLVHEVLRVCPDVHVMRDPTRGGLAASLNEIAIASRCGIMIDDTRVPMHSAVRSVCELLGLDPWLVANEGKFVCMVPERFAADVLRAMNRHPLGSDAALIGSVVSDHPGSVVAKTAIGATRVVNVPIDQQLPRIC